MELHEGDIIVFKDTLSGTFNNVNNIYFTLTNGDYYNSIIIDNTYLRYGKYRDGGNSTAVYDYSNNLWFNHVPVFKEIIIGSNVTINDENFINWLYENTVSGLPPRVMENMYSVVGDQIQYSFSNIGDVVGSIVNNGVLTIFTLGIFIISLAVGILRRLARRNFRKK